VASLHVGKREERRDPKCELALVLAAQRARPGARAELVEAFMGPVMRVAGQYRRIRAVNREELMQAGVVGLLRAVERYDPRLGTPFWAYACWWVRQAMQQLVSELSGPVVLSDRATRQLACVRHSERERLQARGRAPTLGEIEADTGIERAQIEHLTTAARRPRALDEPIGGEASGTTFGDLLSDPRAEDAYERVQLRAEAEDLGRLLGRLDCRERMIVRGRFGLDGPARTLRELACELRVSAERVRQIETRALAKMREAALERP
jgi:RNA polymerase primary sigma factor